MKNQTLLSDIVEALLISEGLETEKANGMDHFHPTETVTTLKLGIAGKNGDWRCQIKTFEQSKRIVVYSIFPQTIPLQEIPEGCLLLTQINYGLLLGNFELDINDGEVRYKTSIDCENMTLEAAALMNVLFGNFFSMDLYFPVISAFIRGHEDPIGLLGTSDALFPSPLFDLIDHKVH